MGKLGNSIEGQGHGIGSARSRMFLISNDMFFWGYPFAGLSFYSGMLQSLIGNILGESKLKLTHNSKHYPLNL